MRTDVANLVQYKFHKLRRFLFDQKRVGSGDGGSGNVFKRKENCEYTEEGGGHRSRGMSTIDNRGGEATPLVL